MSRIKEYIKSHMHVIMVLPVIIWVAVFLFGPLLIIGTLNFSFNFFGLPTCKVLSLSICDIVCPCEDIKSIFLDILRQVILNQKHVVNHVPNYLKNIIIKTKFLHLKKYSPDS